MVQPCGKRVLASAVNGHACRLQYDRVVLVLVKNDPVFLHGDKVLGKSDATCHMHFRSLGGKVLRLSCGFMSTKAYLMRSNQT